MQKLFLFTLIGALLSLSGCSDAPSRRDRRGEAMGPPLPAMSGSESFADGQLLVSVDLSRGVIPRPADEESGDGPRGGGGEFRRRRHGDAAGMEGEGPIPGRGVGRNEGESPLRGRMSGSHMPRIVLQLHAKNNGAEPIEITWIECNSALGNFGVLPQKMTAAPGETVAPERMTSLLGASGEDMPVTVTLRVHGKLEKKTLTVRPVDSSSSSSAKN